VAVDATLRKAIRETGRLEVLPEHLMEKVRVSKGKATYYLLLDSSSSMRLDKKIRLAKSLAWQLLKRSYEKKNKVALVIFRGEAADLAVPPTSDLLRIEQTWTKSRPGGRLL
jgi:magnesium chelatase subunit D